MRIIRFFSIFAIGTALTGCMTSNKVQEMINQSTLGLDERIEANGESLTTLEKTAQNAKEQSATNDRRVQELNRQLTTVAEEIKASAKTANNARVMSAENTVKMAELEKTVTAFKEETVAELEKMGELDKLYEAVLIQQFQSIADSANAAIESLRASGYSSDANTPVNLDEPIEIMAPDTSITATNSIPVN